MELPRLRFGGGLPSLLYLEREYLHIRSILVRFIRVRFTTPTRLATTQARMMSLQEKATTTGSTEGEKTPGTAGVLIQTTPATSGIQSAMDTATDFPEAIVMVSGK